jgi:hypothetical protein
VLDPSDVAVVEIAVGVGEAVDGVRSEDVVDDEGVVPGLDITLEPPPMEVWLSVVVISLLVDLEVSSSIQNWPDKNPPFSRSSFVPVPLTARNAKGWL